MYSIEIDSNMKWNRDQVIEDTIEWDVINWANALAFWSKVVQEYNPQDCKVLCLGERNGGLSLWFALQGFNVICSDYHGPNETAKSLHQKYQVENRIVYSEVNIFDIPYSNDSFDIVACKSVIGGLKLDYKDKRTRTIDNQKLAMNEVKRVLKNGGVFCGAENMRGSWLHMTTRKLMKGDKIGWRHISVPEIYQLFSGFAKADFWFYGFLGSYYGSRTLNKISSWIDKLLSRILPGHFLYIAFIVARK